MAKEKEKDEKDKPDEEDIVIVTEDAENLKAVPPSHDDDDGAPEPKEVKGKKGKDPDPDEDDDDEEDAEDTRLGAAEGDELDEEGRPEKASKGKSRRQRRREAEGRLRRERDYLEKRNDVLERQIQILTTRMDENDRSSLNGRIKQTKSLIAQAESVMEEAANGDKKGRELVEATKIRDGLRDELRKLEDAQERGGRPAPPDPTVVANAKEWRGKNDWFDPNGHDLDSKIARAIDDSLVEEGWDPSTKKYWKELDKRVKERLPHLSKGREADPEDEDDEDEEDEQPQRKQRKRRLAAKDTDTDDEDEPPKRKNGAAGGPRFRTGGPGRELRSNEVYLSKERIEAMKEAGVWDDVETRNKLLKRYRDYDREHGN